MDASPGIPVRDPEQQGEARPSEGERQRPHPGQAGDGRPCAATAGRNPSTVY